MSATLEMPVQLGDLPHASKFSKAVADPIAEDPDAVWYVRPQSGGQFGPASGETMRSWVSEGRVAADSLVWRAGWPDWQTAESTFPHLATKTAPSATTSKPSMPSAAPTPPQIVASSPVVAAVKTDNLPYGEPVDQSFDQSAISGIDEAAARSRPRRKGTDTTILLSGILLVVVIILFIVLAIVLSRQGAFETPTSSKPPASKTTDPENSEKKAAAPETPKDVPNEAPKDDEKKPADE
jgi:hypothetical protein